MLPVSFSLQLCLFPWVIASNIFQANMQFWKYRKGKESLSSHAFTKKHNFNLYQEEEKKRKIIEGTPKSNSLKFGFHTSV